MFSCWFRGIRFFRRPDIALLGILAVLLTAAGSVKAQTVWVNWGDLSAGTVSGRVYGTNDQQCGYSPGGALDRAYADALNKMPAKFLRLHGDTVGQWTTNAAWDRTKVATELNAPYVAACGGANTMITIDIIPTWCRNGNTIDRAKYASFCAQLVKIANKDLGKKIRYWECMNEPDSWPDFKSDRPALFAIYNSCAQAMKKVDPSIHVGGPVISWYDPGLIDQFLDACWDNVDFLSWHKYMTCSSGTDIYGVVMQHISDFDSQVSQAQQSVSQQKAKHRGKDHKIELALDEFNIPCDYHNEGWKQDGDAGAVFFASTLKHLAYDHLDIATNWSAKDGVYGLIDMDDHIRLPYYVYQWASTYLVGTMAATGTDNPDCECFPVLRPKGAAGGRHALLLINKFDKPKTITLLHGLTLPQTATVTILDAAGLHPSKMPITSKGATVSLPGYSVALILMP